MTWETRLMSDRKSSGVYGKDFRIDRYRIIREIGFGSCAVVYLARHDHEKDHEKAALKVLHPHLASDKVILERFHREVAISRKLDHPGIVKIFDLVSWGDIEAIAMEYCPGGNLKGWHTTNPDELLNFTRQVVEALGSAHREGIIHRDLKPQNLLRSENGKIKICDFGSARLQNLIGLTTTSMFMGAPLYVPPETFLGHPPDPRTDFYALGAILYEAAAGRPHTDSPFNGGNTQNTFVEPNSFCPELPENLNSLILCMLGPVEQRPPDSRSVLHMLEGKASIRAVSLKKCLHCDGNMVEDATVCLSCGKAEISIKPDNSLDAHTLILRKISEDVEVMQRFEELLRAISGSEAVEINFLTGDARLYSKEERKRGTRLPVRILDYLSRKDAFVLQEIFNRIGVKTKVSSDFSLVRTKSGPLISAKSGGITIPAAENFLSSAACHTSRISAARLGDFFSDLVISGYRLAREAAQHELYSLLSEQIDKLKHLIQYVIEYVSAMEDYLGTVELGSIYAEIQRLDRKLAGTTEQTEVDDLTRHKLEQLEIYEKYQEIEYDHARITAGLLQLQGLMNTLTNQILASSSKRDIEKGSSEMMKILADLELEIRK